MQVAVRPYLTSGIALVGAGVIAVSPVAPPMPEIEVAAVHSAPVALTATYAELIDNTLSNLGFLGNDLFEEGIAPILQQIAVNQLTLVQDLGAAVHRLFEASNPTGIPATLTTALEQLAAGQIQEAAETLSTGVILAALPVLPPLQVPINNLVAVIDLIPQIIPQVGIALISPPLSLFQGTAAAIQDVVDAFGTGDFTAVVNAIINAPATILDGVINGYPENGFPGLIGANGGALGVIVNIRDMILDAITPPAAATSEEESPTDGTDPVTSTTSDAAMTLTLDVAPVSVETESAEAEATAGTEGGNFEDGAALAGDADDATSEEDGEDAEAGAEDETAGTEDEAAADETATEDGVTDTDESATGEEDSESENSDSGTTDGNKATPGGTDSDDSTSGDGGSTAGDAGDDTDSADAGADGGDAGDSDSGGDSGSGDSE